MQQRRRNRPVPGPLLVKEIILPDNDKPGPSHDYLKNVSHLKVDDLKKVKETESTAFSCLKIGKHEVKSVGKLVSLEKKNQEPYFKGSGKKNRSKKKAKRPNDKTSINELFTESQNNTEETEIHTPKEKPPFEINNIEREKLKQRIQDYERFKKESDREKDIKQRQAEQRFIEKYENLAETWLERLKRRKQLKEEGLTDAKPSYREFYYSKRMRISLVEKKYWRDDKSEKPVKAKMVKETSKSTQEVEDVSQEFIQKLVFYNDESSD